jgi:hypothetical protein
MRRLTDCKISVYFCHFASEECNNSRQMAHLISLQPKYITQANVPQNQFLADMSIRINMKVIRIANK